MSVDLIHPMGSEGSPAPERVDPPDVTHEPPDLARRRVLVAATTALGGIGVVVATVPFIGSMLPSERAKAAGAGRAPLPIADFRHVFAMLADVVLMLDELVPKLPSQTSGRAEAQDIQHKRLVVTLPPYFKNPLSGFQPC